MKTNKKRIAVIGAILALALLMTGILVSCTKEPAVTTGKPDGDGTTAPITTTTPAEIAGPVFSNADAELSTYTNPLKGKDGVGGDLWGDPFMMRYDGKYYIYCSNHTNYVFCYESTDMVNWVDKGKCAYFPGALCFLPSIPVGLTRSTTIRILNTIASA